MNDRIRTFIRDQKSFTFCTAVENIPHCAGCFYTYLEEGDFIVFKSARKSRHISNALLNNQVAGTIEPDISKTGTIKGIQFTGKFTVPGAELLELAGMNYYRRFPFALVIPGELWAIELKDIKMTDNSLGFGKKLFWSKSSPDPVSMPA